MDNLNPDTNYTIRIYPKTKAIGQGPENIIRLKTTVAAPPKPPALNIVSVTDEDIRVNWPSLTNETGEITKVWIIVEPYKPGQLTSEVVHVINNAPFLPFPHEGIRGVFGPYNISNTCQSHIVGFTFLSINTQEICGGFCDKKCEYGTQMLDPTTILPTNDENLEYDNFIMFFNNSNGVLSTRYVPYLTMKKRIDLTSSKGGGTFLIGDGLNNIKSKLKNALLEIDLLYRLRFIVFTSETLYSISDPVDLSLVETNSIFSFSESVYLGIITGIVVLILLLLCCKLIQKRKSEDNSDIITEPIIHNNLNVGSFANPIYWNGQKNTQMIYDNEQNYMDVSILPNYLPEYSLDNTYFVVDSSAPALPVKQKNIYLDTSDNVPTLPVKQKNIYLDTSGT